MSDQLLALRQLVAGLGFAESEQWPMVLRSTGAVTFVDTARPPRAQGPPATECARIHTALKQVLPKVPLQIVTVPHNVAARVVATSEFIARKTKSTFAVPRVLLTLPLRGAQVCVCMCVCVVPAKPPTPWSDWPGFLKRLQDVLVLLDALHEVLPGHCPVTPVVAWAPVALTNFLQVVSKASKSKTARSAHASLQHVLKDAANRWPQSQHWFAPTSSGALDELVVAANVRLVKRWVFTKDRDRVPNSPKDALDSLESLDP